MCIEDWSFLEYYQSRIAPVLKDIDVMLKSNDSVPISVASSVLGLSQTEIKQHMQAEGMKMLTRSNFYLLMCKGSSEICKLFKRECECRSPVVYSCEDIAYIYQMDKAQLGETCQRLGITQVTEYTLPLVMAAVPAQSSRMCVVGAEY